jgi:hypothetical protein
MQVEMRRSRWWGLSAPATAALCLAFAGGAFAGEAAKVTRTTKTTTTTITTETTSGKTPTTVTKTATTTETTTETPTEALTPTGNGGAKAEEGAKAKAEEEAKANEALDKLAKADLSIPSTPATALLDLGGSDMFEPQQWRDFTALADQFVSKDGGFAIPEVFGVEFAPLSLFGFPGRRQDKAPQEPENPATSGAFKAQGERNEEEESAYREAVAAYTTLKKTYDTEFDEHDDQSDWWRELQQRGSGLRIYAALRRRPQQDDATEDGAGDIQSFALGARFSLWDRADARGWEYDTLDSTIAASNEGEDKGGDSPKATVEDWNTAATLQWTASRAELGAASRWDSVMATAGATGDRGSKHQIPMAEWGLWGAATVSLLDVSRVRAAAGGPPVDEPKASDSRMGAVLRLAAKYGKRRPAAIPASPDAWTTASGVGARLYVGTAEARAFAEYEWAHATGGDTRLYNVGADVQVMTNTWVLASAGRENNMLSHDNEWVTTFTVRRNN